MFNLSFIRVRVVKTRINKGLFVALASVEAGNHHPPPATRTPLKFARDTTPTPAQD